MAQKKTIMAKRVDDLQSSIDDYEALGYQLVTQKSGYAYYIPFWHPGKIAVDMIKPEGQLEQRMKIPKTKWRDVI